MLCLALAACSWFDAPLAVQSVAPERPHRGQAVVLTGVGFVAPLEVELSDAAGTHATLPIVDSPTSMQFEVPNIEPGVYTITVRHDQQVATSQLDIQPDPPEVPCQRGYQANTELSLSEGTTTIVRFYADGRQERIRTAIQAIAGVEYVRTVNADGVACSAIHIRKTDGSRLLFEDGLDPLDERAATLAAYFGKPLLTL
jgi:hypothetical protein